jgi:hypothetical protein
MKSQYRVDTHALKEGDTLNNLQLLLADRLDELAERDWYCVGIFAVGLTVWIVSRRSWWWRLWH